MEGSNLAPAEENIFVPLNMKELANTNDSTPLSYYFSIDDFDEWSLMKLATDWTMCTLGLSSCVYQLAILNRCRPLADWKEIYLLHYSIFNIVAFSSCILFEISYLIVFYFPQIYEFFCLALETQDTAATGVFGIVVGLSLDWLNTIRRDKLSFFGSHIDTFHKVFISLVYLLVATNCGVVTYECLGGYLLISDKTITVVYFMSVSIVVLVNVYTIIRKPSDDEKKQKYGLQIANYVIGSYLGLALYFFLFMYLYESLSKTLLMFQDALIAFLKYFAQSAPVIVLIVSLKANERLMKNSRSILKALGNKKRGKFNLLDHMEQNEV